MGIMKIGKEKYWADDTQDLIDDYLDKIGFKFNSKKYTDREYLKFYKRAYKNKTLFNSFSREFNAVIGRKPFKYEFKYHIIFGLGTPKCLK